MYLPTYHEVLWEVGTTGGMKVIETESKDQIKIEIVSNFSGPPSH